MPRPATRRARSPGHRRDASRDERGAMARSTNARARARAPHRDARRESTRLLDAVSVDRRSASSTSVTSARHARPKWPIARPNCDITLQPARSDARASFGRAPRRRAEAIEGSSATTRTARLRGRSRRACAPRCDERPATNHHRPTGRTAARTSSRGSAVATRRPPSRRDTTRRSSRARAPVFDGPAAMARQGGPSPVGHRVVAPSGVHRHRPWTRWVPQSCATASDRARRCAGAMHCRARAACHALLPGCPTGTPPS